MNKPLDIILNSVRKVEWRALKDRLGFIDYNITDILNHWCFSKFVKYCF